MYIKIVLSFILTVSFFGSISLAQDPLRFKEEVEKINRTKYDASREVILFTGSSSVRMWHDIHEQFPQKNIANTGFGGSHTSDLIHYYETLILKYKPVQVFIYEGDNDIASGKEPKQILKDAKTLIQKIKHDLPNTEVVWISAKPSIARWNLKDKYIELNHLLEKYAENTGLVEFADVWGVMLNEDGTPMEDIFQEDKLHMNKKGYEIWAEEIKEFFE